MIHQCSFFRLALAGNQHIQIEMQHSPQHDIKNQDESNIAVRQQYKCQPDKEE